MKVITAAETPVSQNPHDVDVRHLYTTKDVMVSQITLQPGEIVKPHRPPVDVFFYVLDGELHIEVDGETVVAARDALIPSPAQGLHSVRNEGSSLARLLVVKTPNPRA